MALSDELADLYDRLMVGCLQLSRFQQMTIDAAESLDSEDSIPDAALAALEEYLEKSSEPQLTLQLEDTGETFTLTRDEAAYLHRLTIMGTEIEVRYPRLANDMILIYLTTLFEAFVLDSTRAVMLAMARRLRQESGNPREVNRMLTRLVRRQVEDLGFGPIQAKLRFIADTLGITLKEAPETPADIDELYATRNLLVHNGGIVNRKYLSLVRGSPLKIGDQRPVTDDYVRAALTTAQTIGEYLYRALMTHYAGEAPDARLAQGARLTARLSALLGEADA